LSEKPFSGHTLIEKFEEVSNKSNCAIILITPDDFILDEEDTSGSNKKFRPRQNVVLELGYFLGKFGRKSGRVIIILDKRNNKTIEFPSDILGIGYIPFEGTDITEIGENLRQELETIKMHKE
jgi:predicted nucleotide-binding protein